MHCRDAVVGKEGLRRDHRRVRGSVYRKIGGVVLCPIVQWWWYATSLIIVRSRLGTAGKIPWLDGTAKNLLYPVCR